MTDRATIYISDPSMLGAKLLMKFKDIKDYEGLQHEGSATGLNIVLDAAKIHMGFMPAKDIPGHLEGFCGYVTKVGCADENKLLYTLSRIQSARFVIGCGIEPGWDDAGDVSQFINSFVSRLNGLLFVHDSVIDYDGEILAGPLREKSGPQMH